MVDEGNLKTLIFYLIMIPQNRNLGTADVWNTYHVVKLVECNGLE